MNILVRQVETCYLIRVEVWCSFVNNCPTDKIKTGGIPLSVKYIQIKKFNMVIKLGNIGEKTNLSLLTLVSPNSQLDDRQEIYSIFYLLFMIIHV